MLGARWRTSEFYWERAEEIQALANRTHHADTRHELSILAEQFRRMAEFIEQRQPALRDPLGAPPAADGNVTDLAAYRQARVRSGERNW